MVKYIEFLIKNIIESAKGNSELPVYFSDRFKTIITEINDISGNEIASRLLWTEGEKSKKIYIDIDENSNNRISFLISNKAEELLGRNNNLKYLSNEESNKIWNNNRRGTMKINSFINELFNNEYQTKPMSDSEKSAMKISGRKTPSQLLEDFVNIFKSLREPSSFSIVKGSELVKYYNDDNYGRNNNNELYGTLGNSCMANSSCKSYLEFYEKNSDKVSMLIMKDKTDNSKIIGRALVWNLDIPDGRLFMDRIYSNNESEYGNFIKYANENGWLYKSKQNRYANERIIDTIDNKTEFTSMVVRNMEQTNYDNELKHGLFPYLDTLKFYSPNSKILTNDISQFENDDIIYKLEGVDGEDIELVTNYSIDELRQLYINDILNDISYYSVIVYPEYFWGYINTEKYYEFIIKDSLDIYKEDLYTLFQEDIDDIIDYIDGNLGGNGETSNMTIEECYDKYHKLFLNGHLEKYLINKYKGKTPREIWIDEFNSDDTPTVDLCKYFKSFFQNKKFAKDRADDEDINYLKNRYYYI